MDFLSVNVARRIMDDLNEDKNIEKHVAKLRKMTVTTSLLREIELEEALARHAWHPKLSDPVQVLLMKFFRMLRVEDEAREAEEAKQKAKLEEEMKIQKEMAEKENKPEVKLVIQRPPEALPVLRKTQRNVGEKRKNDADFLYEPVVKRTRKEEAKRNEKATQKEDSTSVKAKTENADDDRVKFALEEEARMKKMASKSDKSFRSKKKPMEIKKTVKNVKDSEATNDVQQKPISLVEKIKELPGKLTRSEILQFLNGVSVVDLQEAEKSFGENLKRLDRVWWFLLERDFKMTRNDTPFDPRFEYNLQAVYLFHERTNHLNVLFG